MKRLAAVVVAAAMIVGSLYVRSRIDDDNSSSTTTSGARRVVCSTELAAACDALGGNTTIEDAGTTADRLVTAEGDPGLDAWVVPAPWPEIVDLRRKQAGRDALFEHGVALAGTQLVLVAWKGRVACPAPVTWRCVGDGAAKGLRVGHADPTSTGIGLLVLGQAVVSFFGGRTDLSSTTDLEDPGFDDWFTQLEQGDTVADDPLASLLTTRGAQFDVVGVAEAQATRQLAQAAERDRAELLYPAPMARVVAVLAPIKGTSVDEGRRSGAAAALVNAGWSRATTPSGLPDAGFLDALLERWREIAR